MGKWENVRKFSFMFLCIMYSLSEYLLKTKSVITCEMPFKKQIQMHLALVYFTTMNYVLFKYYLRTWEWNSELFEVNGKFTTDSIWPFMLDILPV